MKRFLYGAAVVLALGNDAAVAQGVSDAELLSPGLGQEAPSDSTSSISIAPNGKTIAFASQASNLVPGDTNGQSDIFTVVEGSGPPVPKILVTGVNGEFPDGASMAPSVSAVHPDGRRFAVAFLSSAQNLIPGFGGPNGNQQVFVSFQPRGENILVSRGLGSASPSNPDARPSNGSSFTTSIAVRGGEPSEIRVAFISNASDLGLGAENPNRLNVPFIAIVKKREGKPGWDVTIRRIPTPDLNTNVQNLVLSGDGTVVAYDVLEPAGTSPRLRQVFRVKEGATEPEVVSLYGSINSFESFEPSLSFNGQVVAFLMRPTQNSSSTPPSLYYVRTGDDFSKPPRQANTDSSGVASDGHIIDFGDFYPSARLAANGFLIAFSDNGSNLANNGSGTPQAAQTYIKNLLTNQIVRTSAAASQGVFFATGGESDCVGMGGAFNSNSLTATFVSDATNLSNGAGSEISNAYRAVLTLPPPPLSQGLPIDAPPDLRVNGTTVTIRLQDFQAVSPVSLGGPSVQASKVTYSVEVKNNTTRKRTRLVTTRNRVTVRKLSPGRYTVRYRASAKPSGSSVVKSKYSPKQPMTIS